MPAPIVALNNGLKMPAFGIGTYMFQGQEGVRATHDAIDAGYRHFDTAWVYKNEDQVGQGIRDKIAEGVVTREEVFFTTKLWSIHHEPSRVEAACRASLANSGLDYIDLYLMHFPVGFVYHDEATPWPKNADGTQETNDVDYVDTWRAMEKLVELGLVRSIGVSNFNSEQITRLLSAATIKPVANQVECSPSINQKKLTQFCKEHDIYIIAYSPLSQPNPAQKTPAYFYDDQVAAIAARHGKTSAQILLRYLYELGTVPIPKSTNKGRIQENISIFDFSLTDDDREYIDGFNTGKRLVNLTDAQHSKYWPFGIEF